MKIKNAFELVMRLLALLVLSDCFTHRFSRRFWCFVRFGKAALISTFGGKTFLLLHIHLQPPVLLSPLNSEHNGWNLESSEATFKIKTRMGSTNSGSDDPVKKYGVQDPTNKNNFTCNFCGQVVKGGVFRFKHHMVGGYKDVKKCPNCPGHVQEEIKAYLEKKQNLKAQQQMEQARFQMYEPDEYDDVGEEDVEIGSSRKMPPPKKPKQKGPMDTYYTPNPHEVVKSRKGGRQQTINEVCQKDLRDKVCREIARWFYDAAIPYNATTYNSFKLMVEVIGQFSLGMKPPSMYELRVPLLRNEVQDVKIQILEHEQEWAEKGCSILSDGWRDSVVQKDITNFMVNSPKGSVFVKSIETVSDVSKDANLLFHVLDKMVEEVGEKNVVQVVTDNTLVYVKAGKLLEAKREHLYWTPCAAHCLDLMLEDIGKKVPKSGKRQSGPTKIKLQKKLVDGEKYPTMGYIYEAMDRAKEAIRDSFSNADDYKTAFQIIYQRWECQLHKPLHAAGHFLNSGIFYKDTIGVACE
ncbi:unnamed protein product [Lactuca saligna]|uniref:DUF659 domain-containing protein n=1 Tax=Lactuca saligna TaxID=75948 RepID=A0AA35ZXH9_LACSI|nr:unnamed protein product [Lactuca saligna]